MIEVAIPVHKSENAKTLKRIWKGVLWKDLFQITVIHAFPTIATGERTTMITWIATRILFGPSALAPVLKVLEILLSFNMTYNSAVQPLWKLSMPRESWAWEVDRRKKIRQLTSKGVNKRLQKISRSQLLNSLHRSRIHPAQRLPSEDEISVLQ